MDAAPQSASQTVLPSMLQTIVEAICDRPRDTAAQRTVRSHAVRETVQGFHPRDPVEIMFAGLAVTHAYLVEDAAHDVFRSQDDRLKARTRSTIVALGRSMSGFLKELRDAQTGWRKAAAAEQPEPESVASRAPDRPLDNAAAAVVKPIAS